MNPAAEDVLGDVETASEQGADVLGGTIGGTHTKSVSRPSDSDAAACVDQCGVGDQSGAGVLGAESITDVRARAHDAMNVPSHTTSASALAKLSSLPTADRINVESWINLEPQIPKSEALALRPVPSGSSYFVRTRAPRRVGRA